jgi:outer membrane receptor protein involved in Fe transport
MIGTEHSSLVRREITGSAAVALLLLAANPATAEEGQPNTQYAVAQGDVRLEEIVVTARKRAELLQDVPISATVVGGSGIVSAGITSVEQLTATLPSVTIAKGTLSNRQFIRGIGSGDNPGFEQSVGTFVDDVYHGRARNSEATLFDLERIEVLKGPQITYFGNNAIAGALNVRTRDPGDQLAGRVGASWTPEFDGYAVDAAVDLPASDTFQLRLAGQLIGQEGWIDDLGAGEKVPDADAAAIRATALWRPDDAVSVRIKAQVSDQDERGGLAIVRGECPPSDVFPGPAGFCGLAIATDAGPPSADFQRSTTPGQFHSLETEDYSVGIAVDLGGATLTSITAYTHYDYRLGTDLDVTPLELIAVSAPERHRQLSQELRLTSGDTGSLSYIAGLYYQSSDLDLRNTFSYPFITPTITAGPPFDALAPYLPFGAETVVDEKAKVRSAFGALTWQPGDRWQLTGALRYTEVDKDFAQVVSVGTANLDYSPVEPFPGALAGLGAALGSALGLATAGMNDLHRDDEELSPSFSVQYDAGPATMLYARYDHGFKAGGFNGIDLSSDPAVLPFAPETVDAVEAGVKTRFLDGRGALDVAVFRSDYDDLQLAGVVPSLSGNFVNRVQNAGSARAEGLDVELEWRVNANLKTSLAVVLLHTHYEDYSNATPTAEQALNGQPFQDLSGQATPFAPDVAARWVLNAVWPLGDRLDLEMENVLFYSDDYALNFNNDPFAHQDSYTRDDLRLSLIHGSGWSISLIGRNLGDEVIRNFGAALPASIGSFVYVTEPPRNVSLQVAFDF